MPANSESEEANERNESGKSRKPNENGNASSKPNENGNASHKPNENGNASSTENGVAGRNDTRSQSNVKPSGSKKTAKSKSTQEPENKPEYTSAQLDAVEKIKKSKDNYEILDVCRDFKASDLKEQYRKMALLCHPDKNKAPGAADAFGVRRAFKALKIYLKQGT